MVCMFVLCAGFVCHLMFVCVVMLCVYVRYVRTLCMCVVQVCYARASVMYVMWYVCMNRRRVMCVCYVRL